jgi:hypothetical protein
MLDARGLRGNTRLCSRRTTRQKAGYEAGKPALVSGGWQPHIISMRNILAVAAMLLPIGAALAETPADRNVIAPYRFPPPAERIEPRDRGRAELYRDQLRESQNRREQLDRQGKLDTLGRRELQDLHGETSRMERALER